MAKKQTIVKHATEMTALQAEGFVKGNIVRILIATGERENDAIAAAGILLEKIKNPVPSETPDPAKVFREIKTLLDLREQIKQPPGE